MLGGVTVNIVLGFLIYMMILFVWGKSVTCWRHEGRFYCPALAKEIGFEDGDKILTVDGDALDNIMDVNRHLFLRSPQTIEVLHASGEKARIAIPDNVGSQMFERGDLFPLMPAQKIYVDSLYPGNPAEKAGLEVGDLLLSFDGKSINRIGFK